MVKFGKKGGVETDQSVSWIYGLVIAVVAVIIIFVLKDKILGAISYLRHLFG